MDFVVNPWAVGTWLVTTGIAMTGLVLGIRAERRAGYRPLWVLDGLSSAINRTGEDAARVIVWEDGPTPRKADFLAHVEADGAMPVVAARSNAVVITWIRPSTDRLYVWPRSASRRYGSLRKQLRRARRIQAR